MAAQDIIQNLIYQLGQSQSGRVAPALDVHYADVDERSAEDFRTFAAGFARFVNFYQSNLDQATGDWSTFFPAPPDAAPAGNTPPHLALFRAYLALYRHPQAVLNQLTGRHLDFYYREVLRLAKQPATPDLVHVVLQLKPQAAPVSISAANPLSAGKDATQVELIYTPTRTTIINQSGVKSLCSLFLDTAATGNVLVAPIANSANGLGAKLAGNPPRWPAFGAPGLPAAQVGFALASPVLRMAEGARSITVKLALQNADRAKLSADALAQTFGVYVSGAKGWINLAQVTTLLTDAGTLQFDFTVPATAPAVVDCTAALHGYACQVSAPVVQFLLNTTAQATPARYGAFANVTVGRASISVNVQDLTTLALASDAGNLDPTKAFPPFGPQPQRGAIFQVGCAEALGKKLTGLQLTVNWKGAPLTGTPPTFDFAGYYQAYDSTPSVTNDYFTANVSFADGGSWVAQQQNLDLFPANGSRPGQSVYRFAPPQPSRPPPHEPGWLVQTLQTTGGAWARRQLRESLLRRPVLTPPTTNPPPTVPNRILFELNQDFLQDAYRTQYVANILKFGKTGGDVPVILNPPYLPTIQSLSLSYQAESATVDVSSTAAADFANPDLQFYQIAYFGQMREQGYQRAQFSFLKSTDVTLLPAYPNQGELLIGLANLNPGDSASVLFQLAEGSSDPDQTPAQINWSVLCDNYWLPLGADGVVWDATNHFLASGIIQFVIPEAATTQNSILPANLIWLRAGLTAPVTAACQFLAVSANAIQARFTDHGNDPGHLAAPLPARQITQFKNGAAPIASVSQPYASFGGRAVESDQDFSVRVSERLRHKSRCVSPWDYERIILEAFPQVHKVKCIPHAKPGTWLAPGNVLIVVVPDLTNQNAVDPLQPRVDAGTLANIQAFAAARATQPATIRVKNPNYQKIQVDFKVSFKTGYEFNYYSRQLIAQIIQYLCPWAFGSARDISFGGTVYKSSILDFVQQQPAVDYLTDFKMYSSSGYLADRTDLSEVRAEAPDTILVSADTHLVAPVYPDN